MSLIGERRTRYISKGSEEAWATKIQLRRAREQEICLQRNRDYIYTMWYAQRVCQQLLLKKEGMNFIHNLLASQTANNRKITAVLSASYCTRSVTGEVRMTTGHITYSSLYFVGDKSLAQSCLFLTQASSINLSKLSLSCRSGFLLVQSSLSQIRLRCFSWFVLELKIHSREQSCNRQITKVQWPGFVMQNHVRRSLEAMNLFSRNRSTVLYVARSDNHLM